LWALLFQDAFSIGIANMALFACTSWFADAWADWIRFVTAGIATFALTEFFILISANLSFNWHWSVAGWVGEHFQIVMFSGWSFAVLSWHANVIFVSQVSRFAEASDDALASANWAWFWIGACWCAC